MFGGPPNKWLVQNPWGGVEGGGAKGVFWTHHWCGVSGGPRRVLRGDGRGERPKGVKRKAQTPPPPPGLWTAAAEQPHQRPPRPHQRAARPKGYE